VGLPQYKDAFLEARIDAREGTQLSKLSKKIKTKRQRQQKKDKL
jgi:hypothetical protein